MCRTPKFIYIKSSSEKRYRLLVPCGKCDECLSSKRAQMVARFKNERKYLPHVYFVTLTYTDENILDLYYKPYYLKYKLRSDMLKTLKKKQENGEIGIYSEFLLSKEHAHKFITELQKFLSKNFHRIKYYLNGEYGCLNNRPHLHCCIFTDIAFTEKEFETIVSNFWFYGDIDVGYCTDAGFNYLAKHTVKEDKGSVIQQKYSPIFNMQSKYKGGIGINLRSDKFIVSNYLKGVHYGTIPNTPFKYALPRYVLKYLHPDNFTDEELQEFEEQGLQRLSENLDQSILGDDFKYNFIESSEQFRNYIKNGLKESYKILNRKFLTKYNKKKLLHSYKKRTFGDNIN